MTAATPAPSFQLNFGEAFAFLFLDPHWPLADVVGQLCWHETTVGGDGR